MIQERRLVDTTIEPSQPMNKTKTSQAKRKTGSIVSTFHSGRDFHTVSINKQIPITTYQLIYF